MKTFIIAIVLIVTPNLFAQDSTKVQLYHHYIHKSKKLLSSGEYINSMSYTIKALQTNINYGGDAFTLLPTFLEKIPINDNGQHFKLLSKYISLLSSKGYGKKSIKSMIKSLNINGLNYVSDSLKPNYYLYSNQLNYTSLVNDQTIKYNFRSWKKNFNKTVNHTILRKLKKIDKIDQSGRLTVSNKKIKKKDSLVFITLNRLVSENNGFPRFEEVGEDGYEIISTCIIHMELERLVTFLPKLELVISNGNAFIGKDIIYSIDRSAIEEGKYLIFENGKYEVMNDTTKFYGFYSFSSVGGFFIMKKTNSEKLKYLFPLHPKIQQEKADLIRSKFYIPSIQESQYKWEKKIGDMEHFISTVLKKPFYINTYL